MKPNVLMVDDEAMVLRSLERVLGKRYQLFFTTSGEQALSIVRDQRIHAIISDQRMPQMTGVELLAKVKQISPNTTRVLLTGFSDLAAITDAINRGEIYRYVTKPWRNDELVNTVDRAVRLGERAFSSRRTDTALPSEDRVGGKSVVLLDEHGLHLKELRPLLAKVCPLYHAETIGQTIKLLGQYDVAVLVVDLVSQTDEKVAFIKTLKSHFPALNCIVLAKKADDELAIELINQGQIYRFLQYPIKLGMLKLSLVSGIKYHRQLLRDEVADERHAVEPVTKPLEIKLTSRIAQALRTLGRFATS